LYRNQLIDIDSDDGGINLITLHAEYDGTYDWRSIYDLFDAEVQIDDIQEIYRVSEAERITCTNIRLDFVGGCDRISLGISSHGQARLLFHLTSPVRRLISAQI
jgi:hypothetical protein